MISCRYCKDSDIDLCPCKKEDAQAEEEAQAPGEITENNTEDSQQLSKELYPQILPALPLT